MYSTQCVRISCSKSEHFIKIKIKKKNYPFIEIPSINVQRRICLNDEFYNRNGLVRLFNNDSE